MGGGSDCGSLCHAFSCAMLHLLPARVLGVTPTAEAFREFHLAPQSGGLKRAYGSIPTPSGAIDVAWELGQGTMVISVQVPEGIQGEFIRPAPDASISLVHDGKEEPAPAGPVLLAPGRHTLCVRVPDTTKHENLMTDRI
ncbi:MAG: hypothetical protein JRI80_19880 [Deltaproteobacteria bacterium]|nr:hypothetical protein [Deltaproteobacteria bacterium]